MLKKLMISLMVTGVCLGPGMAFAKDDPVKKAQALRQAPMKLIANNFGFMNAMAKGKIEWNEQEFTARGRELGVMGQLDLLRGYRENTYEGMTRAKPEVEMEFEEFSDKMREFEQALKAFGANADGEAMKAGLKDLGKSCKSCHKKFKSKEYQGN